MNVLERFENKFIPEPNSGCWLWEAGVGHFHGSFWYKGSERKAHRMSYELYVGAIPEGKQVNHSCNNRLCVNPSHLYIGTQKDNMRDRRLSGGYDNQPKGEEHYNNKLSYAEILTIRRALDSNVTLAKRYKVSPSMISLIRSGKRRVSC